MSQIPAVFCDRDGVLNRCLFKRGKYRAPYSVDELEILPGVSEALGKLRSQGFVLIAVTNQPDARRGWVEQARLEAVNDHLTKALGLDALYVCWHDNEDRCTCRKPEPGLLLEAQKDFSINMMASYMIGDRQSDIEAGLRAGVKPIGVQSSATENELKKAPVVASLLEASELILKDQLFL